MEIACLTVHYIARFGRRTPLCGFMLLGGGCCLSIVGLPRREDMAQLRMLLGLIGERVTISPAKVVSWLDTDWQGGL